MGAQSILYLRLDTYAQFVYLLSFDISRGGGGGGGSGSSGRGGGDIVFTPYFYFDQVLYHVDMTLSTSLRYSKTS